MRAACLVFLVAALSAENAVSKEADTNPENYLAFWEDWITEQGRQRARPRAAPSVLGVTSGFGLGQGTLVFGGAVTNARERGTSGDFDGSFALGAGFGDPRVGIGFDFFIASTSTGDPRDGLKGIIGKDGIFSEGSLGFKVSREVVAPWPQTRVSLSLGASNLLPWGTPDEVDENYFVSMSTLFEVPAPNGPAFPMNLTLGAGSAVSGLERSPGLFGGIGVGVSERMAVSASWLGDELMLGTTFSPPYSDRLQVSLALGDVTRRVSDGRIVVSLGYLWDGKY